MKKHLSTILLILVFLAGLSLLLYPSVSNYWNSFHASRAIASYAEEAANLDNDVYDRIMEEAIAYNASLLDRENEYVLTEEQSEAYYNVLNVTGTGIMGYIEIAELDVHLPIYHGTSDAVLQIVVGHLDWTSLPPAVRGPTASSPATGDCPAQSCSPIWTS